MPESTPAEDSTAENAGPPADAEAEADAPAEFANRAARRAKGKGSTQAQPHGKGLRPGGQGTVQSPRQYGNRRSG
jgi:hypothetical protein